MRIPDNINLGKVSAAGQLPSTGEQYISQGLRQVANAAGQYANAVNREQARRIEEERRTADAVQSIQLETDYKLASQKIIRDFQDNADLLKRPLEVRQQEMLEALSEERERLLSGSEFADENAKALMSARLEGLGDTISGSAEAIYSQRVEQDTQNALEGFANNVSSLLYGSPGSDHLNQAILDMNGFVEGLDIYSSEQKVAIANDLARQFISTTVSGLNEQGKYGAAQALVNGEWFRPDTGERMDFRSLLGAEGLADLNSEIDRAQTRAEVKQRREWALNQNESSTVQANAIARIEQGYEVDQASVVAQVASLSGPEAAASFQNQISRASEIRVALDMITALPSNDAAQAIAGLKPDPSSGSFAEDLQDYNQLISLYQADRKALDADPHAYFSRKNKDWLERIDQTPDEEKTEKRQSFYEASVREQARLGVGIPRVLSNQQAHQIALQYSRSTAEEKVALLTGLQSEYGHSVRIAMQDLQRGGLPASAVIAAGVSLDNPQVAENIIIGAELKKQQKELMPSAVDSDAAFADAFGDAFAASPKMYGAMREAALSLYAQKTFAAGDLSGVIDAGRLEEAIFEVTGGIVEYGGSKILAPASGMTDGDFSSLVESLRDEDLVGAFFSTGEQITADQFRENARLQSVGDGLYWVEIEDQGYLSNDDGLPFVLNLKPISNRRAVEALSFYGEGLKGAE